MISQWLAHILSLIRTHKKDTEMELFVILVKCSSVTALEVVKMTTSSAVTDKKISKWHFSFSRCCNVLYGMFHSDEVLHVIMINGSDIKIDVVKLYDVLSIFLSHISQNTVDGPQLMWCHYNTVNFLQNTWLWGQDVGCLLWVQSLIYALPPLLQRCLWYHGLLGCVIMVPDYMFNMGCFLWVYSLIYIMHLSLSEFM